MTELKLGSLNYVVMIGRLVREPELKFTPKGNPICNFTIAVNRRYRDKETQEWRDESNFFNVVALGQLAERCGERLKKGSPVLIEGRLRSRSWTNQNGMKQFRVEIIIYRIQFLDKIGTEPEAEVISEPDIGETNVPPENLDDLPF